MSLDTEHEGKRPGSGGEVLEAQFYPLYQWLFSDDSDFVSDV